MNLLLAGLIAFSLLPANAVLAQDPTPETASDLNGIVTPSEATPTPAIEATPSAAPDGETIGDPAEQTGADGNPSLTMSGCTRVNVPVLNDAYEQQVVELVNTERAKVGAPPLKRNTDLSYAARYHAKDMIDDVYFTHDTQDRVNGNLTYRCGTFTRTDLFYSSAWGENIAAGQQNPVDVMNAWMNSSGHRSNLLNASHREIGVGYYYSASVIYGFYWVQDFGSQSGVYPVVINNEFASTDTARVELYLYRENTGYNQYRVQNDGGTWTGWMTFPSNNKVSWDLTAQNGTRTVTVETRNSSTGATRSASDTINLSLPTPVLGGLPSSIYVIYDQATGKQSPSSITLRPVNTANSIAINWQISGLPAWLSANPGVNGSTPSSETTLVLSNTIKQTPGTYSGSITVTVTSPNGVINSPTTIPINLTVTTLDNFVNIPLITR